jgi:hypothetical protein
MLGNCSYLGAVHAGKDGNLTLKLSRTFAIIYIIQIQTWPLVMAGRDLIGVCDNTAEKVLSYFFPAVISVNKNKVSDKERERERRGRRRRRRKEKTKEILTSTTIRAQK